MLYDKEVYEKASEIFSKRGVIARREKERRREVVYEACPDYRTADEDIAKLGIQITTLALNGGDSDSLEGIKNNMKMLSDVKKKVLKQAGFPDNYIDDVYACSKCRDTGYIEGIMCECMHKEINKIAYEMSNIPENMSHMTFYAFDVSYYPDEADSEGNNPRKVIMNILNHAVKFMDNFDSMNTKNMLFYGSNGLGKTYLSVAIGNSLAKCGKTVVYYSAKELLRMITDNEFTRDYPRKNECERAYSCDLLIIDDLGSEHITSNSVASFFDILNTRMINSKRMIINTNLDMQALNDIYSARILSRFTEFSIFKFIGKDIRYQKGL